MSDLTYITGILKTAETITGINGCKSFSGLDIQGNYNYSEALNVLAGQSIVLVESEDDNYDYYTLGGMKQQGVRSEWLDSITTQVYWNQVPIDTKIEVSNNNTDWTKRHFSKYEVNSPDGKQYYAFVSGKTSHTAINSNEVISIECDGASASSVNGKYFFIYSKTNNYYVWFDDGTTEDPNPTSPGGLSLTRIKVNINLNDIEDVIATKLKNTLDALADFSAEVTTNTKVVVTVSEAGKVFDPLSGNAGLSISVMIQGGSEESFLYSRLA